MKTHSLSGLAGVAILVAGCMNSEAPNPLTLKETANPRAAFGVGDFDDYVFGEYGAQAYNEAYALEREIACTPGEVMVGLRANIYQTDFNFLEIKCRPINSDGTLDITTSTVTSGYSPSPECTLPQNDSGNGFVVTTLKLNASGNNISRCRMTICYWDPANKRVNTSKCKSPWAVNSADQNWESVYNTMDYSGPGVNSTNYPSNRRVMVGIGVQVHNGNDILRSRFKVGLLH